MQKRWKFFSPSPPAEETVVWLREPPQPDAGEKLRLDQHYSQNPTCSAVENTRTFFESVQKRLKAKSVSWVSLNQSIEPLTQLIGDSESRWEIAHIEITYPTKLELVNLRIGKLMIVGAHIRTEIKGCDVAHLHARSNNVEIIATETNIGKLFLSGQSVSHLEMVGGSILDIECPPSGSPNPFTGTVSFLNVFFPRVRNRYLLKGPQPYRNMRHHLRSLENAQMANLMHSAELAVERDDDTRWNRFLSVSYEWLSDFGSSAFRPLLWLAVFAMVSFAWVYASDGAVLAMEQDAYKGWQSVFLKTDTSGELFRASYLALQPVANPLGIFAKTPLLMADSPWLALWLTIQGFFSVVLIALMIFAIRRRFKISS